MLQPDIENMSIEDIRALISESIKHGKGLISYRKHLLILKNIEKKLKMLAEYRKGLVQEVDSEFMKLSESATIIRDKVKEAMEEDESIPKTETGGKSVTLPDVGTISLSKKIERVVIEDTEKVMKTLGKEYTKIFITLDKIKAVHFAMDNPDKKIPGIKVEKNRELRITFKK